MTKEELVNDPIFLILAVAKASTSGKLKGTMALG